MLIKNERKSLDKIINILTEYSKSDPEVYEGPEQNTINDALYYLIQYRNLTEWFKRI